MDPADSDECLCNTVDMMTRYVSIESIPHEEPLIYLKNLSHAVVSAVNVLQLEQKTRAVYDVNGSLDSNGKLVSEGTRWKLLENEKSRVYRDRLKEISRRLKVPFDQVMTLELLLRVKRARGDKHVLVIAKPIKIGDSVNSHALGKTTSSLALCLRVQNEEDDRSSIMTASVYNVRDATLVRICARCSKSSFDLRRCSTCRSVFYCSTECQRNHWPRHKLDCEKL